MKGNKIKVMMNDKAQHSEEMRSIKVYDHSLAPSISQIVKDEERRTMQIV
jgi:hypothetical protein